MHGRVVIFRDEGQGFLRRIDIGGWGLAGPGDRRTDDDGHATETRPVAEVAMVWDPRPGVAVIAPHLRQDLAGLAVALGPIFRNRLPITEWVME